MAIDSGTTWTFIPQDLFDRLVTHLNETLDPKLEPFITTDGYNTSGLFCIKGTISEELNVTIHFEGDNKLQFRTEQIFFQDKNGKACFGMANSTTLGITEDTFGIYGNNLMGNFLVGYDLDRNVVSFKPTNCIN
ncbi:aspartic proteinase CDR1-like [Rosa rugosa]|uniref:aspartic proteinase CDR1-like n=1 Tax=Rosa rugosa TaxID=74645 RepID=UPI002B404862|nr:aspartic proteinase CDR1-like [Rosa rugosa]